MQIHKALQSGLYGPMRDLHIAYHHLSYQHAALQSKEPVPHIWKIFGEQYEAMVGRKWKPQKQDLFKQVLIFAESAGAITDSHRNTLEEIRND